MGILEVGKRSCESEQKFLIYQGKTQLSIQISNPNISVIEMNVNELNAFLLSTVRDHIFLQLFYWSFHTSQLCFNVEGY